MFINIATIINDKRTKIQMAIITDKSDSAFKVVIPKSRFSYIKQPF